MLLKFNAILKNFLVDEWMRGIKLKGGLTYKTELKLKLKLKLKLYCTVGGNDKIYKIYKMLYKIYKML